MFKSCVKKYHKFVRYYTAGIFARKPSEIFSQKAVRVGILGADTPTGEYSAFLLKQNPLVSHVYLHGGGRVKGITADLNHLDTRSRAVCFQGTDGLPNAIRCADIILMLKSCAVAEDASADERMSIEGKRVVQLSEACSRYAPKAILVVCVPPVSGTLPLAAAVFRRTHWYHPGRIVGSASLPQIKANTMLAEYQNLDPNSVHVPLVGGPDIDCVVPLFSRAIPLGVSLEESKTLTLIFRGLKPDDSLMKTPTPFKGPEAPVSEAFALNRLVTTIALGLCGDSEAICSSFVRTNLINTCGHLVTTVKFGFGGIVHNYGIPKLTRFELKLLEKATIELQKRERDAMEFLCNIECTTFPPMLAKQCPSMEQ